MRAPLPGKILSVAVSAGDNVRKGDELCVIEAMKMGNSIQADLDGVVRSVMVSTGDTVELGAILVTIAAPVPEAGMQRPTRIPVSSPAPAPAPGAVPVDAPQDGASRWRLGVAGAQHQVELAPGGNGSWKVVLDGAAYEV
ncbi:MAG TPA: acetyl-CoA carboxylase biotin carboxyl carrier protein subunit [Chloroflexota bacterium]